MISNLYIVWFKLIYFAKLKFTLNTRIIFDTVYPLEDFFQMQVQFLSEHQLPFARRYTQGNN
jgi:hypothetical protein